MLGLITIENVVEKITVYFGIETKSYWVHRKVWKGINLILVKQILLMEVLL